MGAAEYAGINDNPRFAHLLAPEPGPLPTPAEILLEQERLVRAQYGTSQLGMTGSDERVPVIFSDDGVSVGCLGAEKWFPYNEPLPPRQPYKPSHVPKAGTPVWIGRAVFTHLVLSEPDTLFPYDALYAVAGVEGEAALERASQVRRGMHAWWMSFVQDDTPLVLSNIRKPHRRFIRANPEVPVRLGTTLGWESAYSGLRSRFTPQ